MSYTKFTGKKLQNHLLKKKFWRFDCNMSFIIQKMITKTFWWLNAWLNDRIIDAAQKLIWKALGKIGSCQSDLNSRKRPNYPFRAVNNEHIQLLHDGNNHRLLSFRSSNCAQIRNSRKNHAGRFTLRNLIALYQNFKDTSSGKLTLSSLPVQKQQDGFNCGTFAIAYAAEILDGKSVIDAQFDVSAMRKNLISCLVKRDLRPFPKVNQDKA